MPYTPPAGNEVAFNFTGSYTPTAGNEVEFHFDSLIADAGVYAISGQTAHFRATLSVSPASDTISGQTASFKTRLSAAAGIFDLASPSVGLLPAGVYSLTGEAASFAAAMPVSRGTYTLTGQVAAMRVSLSANAGSYTLTGEAATLSAPGESRQSAVTIICG